MTKKVSEELDYYQQQSRNEYAFSKMLESVKPDLFVIFDLMQKTGINWWVLIKTIRQLSNISMGTGYGTVSIHIENHKVTFIRGEESDKLNEDLVIKKKDLTE